MGVILQFRDKKKHGPCNIRNRVTFGGSVILLPVYRPVVRSVIFDRCNFSDCISEGASSISAKESKDGKEQNNFICTHVIFHPLKLASVI